MSVTKILTDTPLLDEIVYYSKIMCLDTVIKDKDEADLYETLESIKNANIYISCIEGRATFNLFEEYPLELIEKATIPEYIWADCLKDKSNIPLSYRDKLVELMVKKTIDEYDEKNNYYRLINGLPKYGERGLIISSLEYNIPEGIDVDGIELHTLDTASLNLLKSKGIIDKILEDHPTEKYLRYVGDRSVSFYKARTALDFSILYIPKIEIDELYKKFSTKLENNRNYIRKCVYNEAFKLNSDYYNKFIIILILIQSFIDMIIDAPEYLIRRDVFDIRTVQYFFESFGIPFYAEIPIKYQVKLVKNLNKLIKYKSTTKNIIDICSLFGFDDITIFKYYILKDRKVDINGDYVFNYTTNEKGERVEDLEKNYDLKFFKTPINGDMEESIRNPLNFIDYDDVTYKDPYWDGDKTHSQVKNEILNMDFNLLLSKYMSIDAVYQLTNISFERPYFFSILFEDTHKSDLLKFGIPYFDSNKSFRLTDCIIFIYSLMYMYYGIEDDIMNTPTKIMHIKGFNFKADMKALSDFLDKNNTSLEKLGIKFNIPTGNILSFSQLLEIFNDNNKLYDFLVSSMNKSNSYKEYNIYKTIYDSLMISEENNLFFKLKDGTIAKTYSEYLIERDPILYSKIALAKNIENDTDRNSMICTFINYVIQAIEDYIDSDTYKYLFSNMPTVSLDAALQYIYKIIDFFRSYKVNIMTINNIYRIRDTTNKIEINDRIGKLQANTYKYDIIPYLDEIILLSVFNKTDNINIRDMISCHSSFTSIDNINIYEKITKYLSYHTEKDDAVLLDSIHDIISCIDSNDKIDVIDRIWVDPYLAGVKKSGTLNTARADATSAGTQDELIIIGGTDSNSKTLISTEKCINDVISTTSNLNNSKSSAESVGKVNNAVVFGGTTNSIPNNITEKFNGSTWAISNNMITARFAFASAGSDRDILAFAGSSIVDGDLKIDTEKFNGSTWMASNNINTPRLYGSGCGESSISAILVGGISNIVSNTINGDTEIYNGSVWSNGPKMNNPSSNMGVCGIANNAISIGGINSSIEIFNGFVWKISQYVMNNNIINPAVSGVSNAAVVCGGKVNNVISSDIIQYNDRYL